ncbi:restriction endonuclease subunit S [Clostridium sp.]|uniref:restriction endonuclease subunit S n=1 Tax=Clostridium sp. TaxID=1506 RepID=UPI0026DB0D67|nr:restriction endonuclease subunit S [Clostridium sp.]MDO5039068.1 restriction endonuclease subunit S [Clostridium sp.]
MRYKSYENYKNSNINYLPKLPSEWDIMNMKYLISDIQTGSTPSTKNEDYFNGNIQWFTPGDFTGKFLIKSNKTITDLAINDNQVKLLKGGTVCIVGIGATLGKVAILKNESSFNQQVTGISTNEKLNNKYLYYWLLDNKEKINKIANYTTLPIINNEFLKNLKVFVPSIEEQEKIVEFLDKKTSEIDGLINKKERLIELLKEKQEVLIREAVTKGLDKNIKMKNSGIDWIGEIPENWDISLLKYISHSDKYSIVDGPFGSDMKNEEYVDEGVPIIQLNNIGEGIHKFNNIKYITEQKAEDLKRHTVYPGEIVIAKMMPAGRATIVSDRFDKYIISSDSIRLKLSNEYNYEFVMHCLNSYGKFEANINSTGSTRSRINLSIIKNMKIAIPNKNEQDMIVNYLNKKLSILQELNDQIWTQIKLLKEYRQSLISELVTGKIDIR